MFNFGGFTETPRPHEQETRRLETIQATPLQEIFLGKGRFLKCPEITKNPQKSPA